MKFFNLISIYLKFKFLYIGLDFGNSNSLISFIKNNKINLFHDKKDKYLNLSLISYNNFFKIYYSNEISNNILCNNNNTIFNLKFLLNKNYNNIIFKKNFFKNFIRYKDNFKLNSINGFKCIFNIFLDFVYFLKKNIYISLNFLLNNLVVSIPVYYNNKNIEKYKKVFFYLNSYIICFINEPISSFFSVNNIILNGNYIVYDFGNSTIDFSLIDVYNNLLNVIYIEGDNEIGCLNFNFLLLNYIFFKKKNLKIKKYNSNLLKKICFLREKITYYNLSIFNYLNKEYFIKIKEYELIINFIIEKTIYILYNFIKKSKIKNLMLIKNIILTGGCSLSPIIKYKIYNLFYKSFNFYFNPLKSVCIGCSIFSFYLFNNYKKKVLFLNKIPFSIGIEVIGGYVEKIIKKNSNIPIISYKDFLIFNKNQKFIFINVLLGENNLVNNCLSLFYFKIENFFYKNINYRFRVYFKINKNGFFFIYIYNILLKKKIFFIKTFLKNNYE